MDTWWSLLLWSEIILSAKLAQKTSSHKNFAACVLLEKLPCFPVSGVPFFSTCDSIQLFELIESPFDLPQGKWSDFILSLCAGPTQGPARISSLVIVQQFRATATTTTTSSHTMTAGENRCHAVHCTRQCSDTSHLSSRLKVIMGNCERAMVVRRLTWTGAIAHVMLHALKQSQPNTN